MQKITTDYRVLAILTGGENLLNIIDPEGLFINGWVSTLRYHIGKDKDSWGLVVCFDSRNFADVRGSFDEDGKILILSVSYKNGKSCSNIDIKPNSSLVEAFGDLSRLPVPLKQDIGQFKPRNADSGESNIFGKKYYSLVRDAALWNVEGGKDSLPEDAFSFLQVDFGMSSNSNDQSPWIAEISLREPIDDGFIELAFKDAIFGLSDKHIFLNKNLGQGHCIRCECFYTQENRKVPSLKLAFDLSKDLVAKVAFSQEAPVSVFEEAKQLDKQLMVKKKKKTEVKNQKG